ncbi:MAG: pilus assembly protein PilM [Planctomycetota bacterium]|jgi:type IV pilus assembly protein PilM
MDDIIVSVPSQNSFARFVTLPPVEQKRIPEMVKFEAVQQIPFDINNVQWDWQLMTEADSPEIKVGIFAIKDEVVDSALEHFGREEVQVSYVQMSPMALYNYVFYDRPDLVTSNSEATVILNIGADNTDLVVCTNSAVWQRCILIGGNAFTKAIADTFKLNFDKAEKLKRTAPVSKYARQIFQAMRPIFTDLASEVQRSLSFYNSSNPNTKIVKVIGMGGGTKLRGLLKYIQQTLQIPVERPDVFKRLAIGPGVSPAKFHESVCDFGIVYGLALQGLGLARIESNLLPRSIARSMAWAGKGRYFIAAACMVLAVSLLCFARTGLDRMSYDKKSPVRQRSASLLNTVQQTTQNLQETENKGSEYGAKIDKEFKLFEYRKVIPVLHETIISALPNEKNNPKQAKLYRAFANGDVEGVFETPRKQRKQLFITNMSVYFSTDLAAAQFGGADLWRKSRGTLGIGGELEDEYYDEFSEEYEMMEMYEYGLPGLGYGGPAVEEKKLGFVLTIAGYSPHENIDELIYPAGVGNNQNQWGFVTRLLHLDDFVDGNSPFGLYEPTDPNQFNLKTSEVSLDAQMPSGIGAEDFRETKVIQPGQAEGIEWILVDPMTKETINKVAVLDEDGKPKLYRGKEVYEVNDHWFVLNVKFVWREAPEALVEAAQPPLPGQPMYPGSPVAPPSYQPPGAGR